MTDDLATLLARTRYLLLDFDGPICSIFAGRSARSVVDDLLELLRAAGAVTPPELDATRDPFDVLRHAATIDTDLSEHIEHALTAAEIDAAGTASPTPRADEVIRAWQDGHRALAVVSNNSAAAVRMYLDAHQLDVRIVVARTDADPEHLKPSPFLINGALAQLQADPAASALLGDSVTDVAAAHRASIASIGFANKPGKHDKLAGAGADVIIDDMQPILHATSASTSA